MPAIEAKTCICSMCDASLPSKSALFKHLEQVHSYVNPNAKPCKVAILIGWLSHTLEDNDAWVRDLSQNTAGENWDDMAMNTNPTRALVETAVFAAIYAMETPCTMEEALALPVSTIRPKSVTRASCHSRAVDPEGLESSTSGLADLFCVLLKRPPGEEQAWLDQINTLLPADIRALQCRLLPANGSDFHSNVSCTQQKYEVILPLSALLPPPSTPHDSPAMKALNATLEKLGAFFSVDAEDHAQALAKREAQAWQAGEMDQRFPAHTEEGKLRVRFFRILKKILRGFGGKYVKFHNFVSGGCTPEDASSERKVDRFYHKELVQSENETFVILSVSGDSFLRGQIRRMVGVTLAIIKGYIPMHHISTMLRPDVITTLPAIPGFMVYLSEVKFANWEAKYPGPKLDPRRDVNDGGVRRFNGFYTGLAADGEEEDDDVVQMSAISAIESVSSRHAKDGTLSPESTLNEGLQVPRVLPSAASTDSGTGGDIPALLAPTSPNLARVLDWKKSLQAHVIRNLRRYAATATAHTSALSESLSVPCHETSPLPWLSELRQRALVTATQLDAQLRLLQRPTETLEADGLRLYNPNRSIAIGTPCTSTLLDITPCTSTLSEPGDDDVPACYARVLYLLRQADRSGRWPGSSSARAQVIHGVDKKAEKEPKPKEGKKKGSGKESSERGDAATEIDAAAAETGTREKRDRKDQKTSRDTKKARSYNDKIAVAPSASTSTGSQATSDLIPVASGSFSVGVLPAGQHQPKGNELFPELLRACFALEAHLFPNRPPSSMIAINRHAQFKPHRDSGAGNGQTISLIVALGRFTGGELGVEGEVHSIRYAPLEFDGWSQRHWTMPFAGERYSLVWFTPLGVDRDELWWLDEKGAVMDEVGEGEGSKRQKTVPADNSG